MIFCVLEDALLAFNISLYFLHFLVCVMQQSKSLIRSQSHSNHTLINFKQDRKLKKKTQMSWKSEYLISLPISHPLSTCPTVKPSSPHSAHSAVNEIKKTFAHTKKCTKTQEICCCDILFYNTLFHSAELTECDHQVFLFHPAFQNCESRGSDVLALPSSSHLCPLIHTPSCPSPPLFSGDLRAAWLLVLQSGTEVTVISDQRWRRPTTLHSGWDKSSFVCVGVFACEAS